MEILTISYTCIDITIYIRIYVKLIYILERDQLLSISQEKIKHGNIFFLRSFGVKV